MSFLFLSCNFLIFFKVFGCFSFMYTVFNLNTKDISSIYSTLFFLLREFGPFWASVAGCGPVMSGSALFAYDNC